jgi:peptidoglycan hydrolase-like protein with peptidoglycan-binding domain
MILATGSVLSWLEREFSKELYMKFVATLVSTMIAGAAVASEPAAPAAGTPNTATSAATTATDAAKTTATEAAKTTATKAETTLKGQTPATVTLTEVQIKQVQKALKVKETGKIDAETTAAIVKFQKGNKLSNTTGVIDTDTAAKLGVKL